MDPDRRTSEAPLTGDPPNPIDPPPRLPLPHPLHIRRAGLFRAASRRSPIAPACRRSHSVACLMATPGSGHPQAPDRGRMSARPAAMPTVDAPIVDVQGLTVASPAQRSRARRRRRRPHARPGRGAGLLGESGSGKSVTLRALMRLLPERARRSAARSVSTASTCWRCAPASSRRIAAASSRWSSRSR